MPLAIKNIFKLLDDGAHAFDANLLVCHSVPRLISRRGLAMPAQQKQKLQS